MIGVSYISLTKTDGLDPKKWEDCWMKTLKAMATYDVNTEDNV